MPAVSRAQLIAMRIAAAGKSNLGIPQKVGQAFIAETPKGADLPARVGEDQSAHHKAEYDRHEHMAKHAPTHASRQFHKKMCAHYEGKLK